MTTREHFGASHQVSSYSSRSRTTGRFALSLWFCAILVIVSQLACSPIAFLPWSLICLRDSFVCARVAVHFQDVSLASLRPLLSGCQRKHINTVKSMFNTVSRGVVLSTLPLLLLIFAATQLHTTEAQVVVRFPGFVSPCFRFFLPSIVMIYNYCITVEFLRLRLVECRFPPCCARLLFVGRTAFQDTKPSRRP
jgi:hypothetical protein